MLSMTVVAILVRILTLSFSIFFFFWKLSVPYRVEVIAWLFFRAKSNTLEVLHRKTFYCAFSPSWCVMCKREGETLDHLPYPLLRSLF